MARAAIVVIDAWRDAPGISDSFLPGPLECVELAGRSLLERWLERFAAVEVEATTILVSAANQYRLPAMRANHGVVTIEVVRDLDISLKATIASYAHDGIQHAFISWASDYVETDLLDLLCFHRESKQGVTPTYNGDGPLSLWAVDCEKARQSSVGKLLDARHTAKSRYFVREYVNRVTLPERLRTLGADILSRRCETAPAGMQVRPGVWLDAGAKVHRRTRIVAPAYIGCGSCIEADALITRLSTVDRNCRVQSGTVIEDSSILENTSVGICLDVCHSVASGNKLLNLKRGVVVEISDPRILWCTGPASENASASVPHGTHMWRVAGDEQTAVGNN
jgi:NDP-sugar pyrophosphorylase family protein